MPWSTIAIRGIAPLGLGRFELAIVVGVVDLRFEQRLFFSQAEAMNYAAQLAKALLPYEDNADRKKFLTDVAQRATELHDRLEALLTIKS